MAKKSDYNDNIKKWNRADLKPTETIPTIKEMVEVGDKLLEAEDKAEVKMPKKTIVSSDNPYLLARLKVLTEMTSDERKAIDKMEKAKDVDNSIYTSFVRKVCEAGDILSDLSVDKTEKKK